MIEEAFPQETVVPDRDVITPVHSVNDGLNPDCGNVAFMEIHKYLPVVPGPNILASDYFAFDAATSLGLPSIHHSDAVFHEYDSTRKSSSNYRTGKELPVLQIILTHMPRFILETYRPFWELNLAHFPSI